MEKLYWFSTKQHAHDVEFRCNRVYNNICGMENKGKKVPDSMYRLHDDLEAILCYMAGSCDRPVQLPGRLYAIARDSVAWANSVRG